MWQPKWNENQTVVATAIHTPDKDAVPWKAEWLGAGVWGLWSDPRVRAAVDCREAELGDMRHRLWWEMPVEESQVAMEARQYC